MSNFRLLWANLHRHPVRTYLTLLSVLVAFLLFGLLRTLAVWFGSGAIEGASVDRLIVAAKYSMIDSLPISQMNVILAVDGVEAVTHQSWFGGNYQDPSNFFAKYPVEPRAYFEMFPELAIDPALVDTFERTRTGAVVPESMRARFGWQIGDRIPIEADIWPMQDGNRLWEFDLVGTYTTELEGLGAFLFHYDFFDEARAFERGTVGWYTVRIADPDLAPEVANSIDELFKNSLNPTKTATEDEFARAFAAQLGDIGLMATGILSAVFFTVLLLTGNTMSQALRERIPELAVLKTLGFGNSRVARLVLGESVLLCAFGGLLGIGLGAAVAPAVGVLVQQFGMGGGLSFSWWTAGTGIGVAVLLGVIVGAIPALTAARLSIAEALRRS